MSSATISVIIASAQSVGKVFVIGAVGYLAVVYPRDAPFLPREFVGKLARFTFHTLTIPLIYSSIAVAVTIDSIGDYWFVIVGAFVVLGMSYLIVTILRRCCISINNERDFQALRIAATFPNIVSLPILIFPSLCEFPVVHEGYFINGKDGIDDTTITSESLERQCIAQSTTMIFMYFFSWSILFWSFGNTQLMNAATMDSQTNNNDPKVTTERSAETLNEERAVSSLPVPCRSSVNHLEDASNTKDIELSTKTQEEEESTRSIHSAHSEHNKENETPRSNSSDIDNTPPPQPSQQFSILTSMCTAVKKTVTSPGFLAMVAGFVTACISPIQEAMFESGGALRFFGSAMETLGMATTPLSTMVVAASLVPSKRQHLTSNPPDRQANQEESPIMSDPNFGPYNHDRSRRSSYLQAVSRSLRSGSIRMLQAVPRSSPEMIRMHLWFCLGRLVLSPAVIVGIIVGIDCSGSTLLSGVPNLAKLVIIVNSALPGALIVIVLLKSKEEMSDTAAAVAKVYMPSYLLSIFTIAVWTAVGLWVTLPDQHGLTVCQRN